MLGRIVLHGVVALLAAPAQSQAARAFLDERPATETADTTATFTFTATPGALFSGFDCRVDDGPWKPCVSPYRLSGLIGGPHSFAVSLRGLFADRTPDAWTWTVTVPTVALPTPVKPPQGGSIRPPRDPLRRDARGCAYGANRIDEATRARLEQATVCLINVERAERELAPVRLNAALTLAARRHARDMVERRYFAHISPAGSQLKDRAARAGYLRGADGWGLGEVLGWSANPPATPNGIVQAWMRSVGHKHVLVGPSYRDVGVGVKAGAPQRGVTTARAGTFAAVFGSRR